MTSYESLKKELNDPNQIFLRGKFIDYWLKLNTKIVEKQNGTYDLDQIGKSAKIKYEGALKDFSDNMKKYKKLIDEIEGKVSERLYDASNNISNISKSIYEKKQIIKDTENEKTKYATSRPFIKDHYIRKNYTYVNLGLTTIGVGALFYILFRQIKME